MLQKFDKFSQIQQENGGEFDFAGWPKKQMKFAIVSISPAHQKSILILYLWADVYIMNRCPFYLIFCLFVPDSVESKNKFHWNQRQTTRNRDFDTLTKRQQRYLLMYDNAKKGDEESLRQVKKHRETMREV